MRCKLYGAGSASVRVTVAVAGLLTALAFLLILFPRSYFASRGAADRLNFARNFLQQFEGTLHSSAQSRDLRLYITMPNAEIVSIVIAYTPGCTRHQNQAKCSRQD